MLPDSLAEALHSAPLCQFATTTSDGTPINTELLLEVGDAGTLDVSTGLAYPAKAERARRNPRVGLWIEVPDGPVLSVQARAAVRDADIAANGRRYRERQAALIASLPGGSDPDVVARAVWYWSRIYIECHPVAIQWWPSPDELATPGRHWVAEPAPSVTSDPSPTGSPTRSGATAPRDWKERAVAVGELGVGAFLTTVDPEGYPIPVGVTTSTPTDAGFEIECRAPALMPSDGPACLTFGGAATFIGRLRDRAFEVDRMLPDLVLVTDQTQILEPGTEVQAALTARLETELERRGQSLGSI